MKKKVMEKRKSEEKSEIIFQTHEKTREKNWVIHGKIEQNSLGH